MFVASNTKNVARKLKNMSREILVTQHTDIFSCDCCKREIHVRRYDGESRRALRVTCLCNAILIIQ